jgi:D-galactose 1-dehydrogenase
MSAPFRLGLVGLGKIAIDEHLPAIASNPDLTLAAIASRNGSDPRVPCFSDLATLLAQGPEIDAVVMCQPPQPRFEAARMAIRAGKHVFLEKPPGASVSEVAALEQLAQDHGVTLFTSWHSRFATQVPFARQWISRRSIDRVTIMWCENVRQWHPGQDWLWRPGGFGVFDPGINALSIVTGILPEPLRMVSAELDFPANRQAAIAALLRMESISGTPVVAKFDFREVTRQCWDIRVDAGTEWLSLGQGGNIIKVGDEPVELGIQGEYPAMYRHFAALVKAGASDVDAAPLQLVADAFLIGHHRVVEPFID